MESFLTVHYQTTEITFKTGEVTFYYASKKDTLIQNL